MSNVKVVGEGFNIDLNYNQENGLPLWAMLVELERAIIGQTLELFDGNKAKTADHLHLNRTTLVEKAKKYGFPTKSKRVYTEDADA